MAVKHKTYHLNLELSYVYSYIIATVICYAFVAVAFMAGLFLNPAFARTKGLAQLKKQSLINSKALSNTLFHLPTSVNSTSSVANVDFVNQSIMHNEISYISTLNIFLTFSVGLLSPTKNII